MSLPNVAALVEGLAHTDGIAEVPDVGPGMGRARDDALDADARGLTNAHQLPPGGASASDAEALADVDAAIAAARCAHGNVVTACAQCQPRCGLTGRCCCTP